jgi:excisionase family DNA binding protein
MIARKVVEEQKRLVSSPAPVVPVEPVDKSLPVASPSSERKVKEKGLAIIPLLLTVSQVCALLNISRSTLFRLEKSGEIPGRVTIGGQVRYHRQVIEEWLLEQAKGQEGKGNDTK